MAGTLVFALLSCNDNDSPSQPPPVRSPGNKTPTVVGRADDPPGIVLAITGFAGGTLADGSFQAGDRLAVTFTVKKQNGDSWRLDDFTTGRIMVSGPTFNYQRVLPERQDLLTASVANADGSFTYRFADPLPANYAAPVNDTLAFGADDGELAGQALLAGTYTAGMYVSWNYTVDGNSFRDSGNATADFLFGGATQLASREVVKQDGCNQCHQSLRAHGGIRRDVKLCVLCHTSGSEDRNDPAREGGTPDVTIDFRVMIHRIHNGAHLPSVLGVGTNPDGSRNYAVAPKPYKILGGNSVNDFSGVNFPAWPNGMIAMPRDQGYTALTAAQKATEDTIRSGVSSCTVCHGDPDGQGPKTAPAQGNLAYAQPSRRACASCHDDVDWSHPYRANGSTMPAQNNDSTCLLCHGVVNSALSPEKAHVHPLLDAAFNTGTNFELTAVAEAGVHDNDGTIDPGEKVAVTIKMTDDNGGNLAPSSIASINVVLSGPTTNSNMVLTGSIPTAALTGSPPYRINLPELSLLEHVGAATAQLGDVFRTARTPHWDMTGAVTNVYVQTSAEAGVNNLAAAARAPQNWLDLTAATGLARNDYVVVDAELAGQVEYLQIQYVEGNRIWFAAAGSTTYVPGTRKEHAAGATVREVTLALKRRGTDYTLDAPAGRITEVTEFGDGNPVVVSYTTDFLAPTVYPLALNDTPTLDESSGKWTQKPVVDGTYAVTLWGSRNLTLELFGETNAYRSTSVGARREFLFGAATQLKPYDLISSGDNCNACHQDVMFHGGGRRGFDTCIACHGTAGSEDRPQYVAPNAPATAGVTINFRTMLHKIHMGEELANASSYTIVGFGSTYPNNYSAHTYEHVVFPAMPGGTRNCTTCHGAGNTAWSRPLRRDHPTAQVQPVKAWRAVCGACHDSDAAAAHIDAQTSPSGFESCAVCHDNGKEWHVPLMHKAR